MDRVRLWVAPSLGALALAALMISAPGRAALLDWSAAETIVTGTNELAGPLNLRCSAIADEQHLLYFNESDEWIGYAHREEGGWSSEAITGAIFPSGWFYSLFVWGNVPVASYYVDSQDRLCLARGLTAGWEPEYIPGTADARAVRATADSAGNYHVLWLREVASNYMLTHNYLEGSVWHNESVEVLTGLTSRIDLALDDNDVPHAAWYDPSSDEIHYGRREGTNDWTIETVATGVDNCFWLDLEILGTSIPYIGYTEYDGASSIFLRSKRRATGWVYDLNVTDQGWLFGAAMAVSGEGGVTTPDRYFVCGTADGFIYYYRDADNEWQSAPIPELAGYDLGNVFDLAWNPVTEQVALAFHGPNDRTISYFVGSEAGPTATPTPPGQPTPTPTPTAGGHGVEIQIAATLVHPGDTFWLGVLLHNPYAPADDVPLCVLLDVYGEYWFWPSWAHYAPPGATGFDFELVDVPSGTSELAIIPAFTWPATGPDAAGGLFFHGAMLTGSMDALWGDLDSVQWGYGP